MQRPGHRNLLEKTKVMGRINQKRLKLIRLQSETVSLLLDENRLIELESWLASHCETKSHANLGISHKGTPSPISLDSN